MKTSKLVENCMCSNNKRLLWFIYSWSNILKNTEGLLLMSPLRLVFCSCSFFVFVAPIVCVCGGALYFLGWCDLHSFSFGNKLDEEERV